VSYSSEEGDPRSLIKPGLLPSPAPNRRASSTPDNFAKRQLDGYVDKLQEYEGYDRMFYVYHDGKAETDDERVNVIGPGKLAELLVDAGLVDWLIRKVS
jgi:hypothetical protein